MALVAVLTSSVPALPARAATTVVLLQMNLCNSGMASCYSSGRSVEEAVAKIHQHRPALVTLQEICRDDVYAKGGGWGPLAQAMADLYGGDRIAVDFVPAMNRRTGEGYRCHNGEQFGLAILHHGNGREVRSGWYTAQDRSPEVRAWTCATVLKGRLTACTTHLSIRPDIALRQCRELMSILAAPRMPARVIVSGDLNLVDAPGGPNDVGGCVPPAYDRRGDNALQHVLFTRNIRWVQGAVEGMRWTDHPLLSQTLRA
jgi:hypothetical protein